MRTPIAARSGLAGTACTPCRIAGLVKVGRLTSNRPPEAFSRLPAGPEEPPSRRDGASGIEPANEIAGPSFSRTALRFYDHPPGPRRVLSRMGARPLGRWDVLEAEPGRGWPRRRAASVSKRGRSGLSLGRQV